MIKFELEIGEFWGRGEGETEEREEIGFAVCVFFFKKYQDRDTWSWCWDLTFGGIGLVVSSWIDPFLFSSIKPTYVQFLIVLEMFRSRMWGVLKDFEKELTE